MSIGAKIILTIVVCVVLAAVAAVGAGALLWSRHGEELLQAGARQYEQGVAFGHDTDESGCLDAAIARYKGTRGMSGSLAAGVFVRGCWKSSRPTAGFCEGVPKPLDLLRAARWQRDQARKAGIDEQFGGQIFGQLRAYCDSKAGGPVSR
jgi:hypothetical protein